MCSRQICRNVNMDWDLKESLVQSIPQRTDVLKAKAGVPIKVLNECTTTTLRGNKLMMNKLKMLNKLTHCSLKEVVQFPGKYTYRLSYKD